MFPLTIPPLRNHRGMLAKQEHIPDRIRLAGCHYALLQRVRLGISNQSKLDNLAALHRGSISL
jgi:hypothetical protein